MIEKKIVIEGMGCSNCVKKVKKALKQLEGIKTVKVELDSGKVLIKSLDMVDNENIQKVIEEIGYKVIF